MPVTPVPNDDLHRYIFASERMHNVGKVILTLLDFRRRRHGAKQLARDSFLNVQKD